MITQTIGIREFRQNMTTLYKKAQKEQICFIVMNHQEPVMRIEPIDEDRLVLEKYAVEIEESLAEVRAGKTYPLQEVMTGLLSKKK